MDNKELIPDMPITNFTDLINGTGIIDYSMSAYINILGAFTYPLIFCGIIGYVYMKQQSVIAASVATLILFAAFNTAILGVDIFVTVMHILITISIGALFLMFFSKWRQ